MTQEVLKTQIEKERAQEQLAQLLVRYFAAAAAHVELKKRQRRRRRLSVPVHASRALCVRRAA